MSPSREPISASTYSGGLISNLDGVARAFKEQGRGHVWFAATAQQTLKDIPDQPSRS